MINIEKNKSIPMRLLFELLIFVIVLIELVSDRADMMRSLCFSNIFG
jgi:hypothetical protein